MNDRKQALVKRIQQLREARKVELRAIARLEARRPRLRILDRAFAQVGAACLMLAIFAGSAEARTHYRPAVVVAKARTVIVVVPQYVQPRREVVYYPVPVPAPACPSVTPTPRPRFQGASKYAAGN